jgi:hypothetical protein
MPIERAYAPTPLDYIIRPQGNEKIMKSGRPLSIAKGKGIPLEPGRVPRTAQYVHCLLLAYFTVSQENVQEQLRHLVSRVFSVC